MENYSILMTVYKGEDPQYFTEAIESMLAQTVKTNDFVIVCDGELTPELDEVIAKYVSANEGLFNIHRLKENSGVGVASAQGVLQCKNELIAKMDSDDISHPDRCEKQIACFEKEPELAVVGSYILEFQNDDPERTSIRKVPLTAEKIFKYSKRRSPFNNPTVMYRKSVVLEVGNYKDLRRCEDYELYTRILHAGHVTKNIPECLLDYRIAGNTYSKRNNYVYIKDSRMMSYRLGHSSLFDVFFACASHLAVCFLPVKVRAFIYEKLIRRF